mmetsp:Transcript_8356/g.13969  ORF Transcript_8356/g.13969 Transcript_8356/m.13969 type:complete len:115 (-) Transcript_8356:841-1185(-)
MLMVLGALWFSNMGGIGGGGILVPIIIAFFRFDSKNAIALSNFSIFLSSLIRFFLNSYKTHPLKKGKGLIVDMNISVLMLPGIISGVSFGVILNILMPSLIIQICYIIILGYLG